MLRELIVMRWIAVNFSDSCTVVRGFEVDSTSVVICGVCHIMPYQAQARYTNDGYDKLYYCLAHAETSVLFPSRAALSISLDTQS